MSDYMAQKMDDQIEGSLREQDRIYKKIKDQSLTIRQQAEEIRLLREKFIFHVAGELYEQGNQWTDAEAIANYKLSQVDADIEAVKKAVK